jgi:hypothetical protein
MMPEVHVMCEGAADRRCSSLREGGEAADPRSIRPNLVVSNRWSREVDDLDATFLERGCLQVAGAARSAHVLGGTNSEREISKAR